MDNLNTKEELNEMFLFSAPVYKTHKPEFLKVARQVSQKFISKRKKEKELNSAYPVYMTENLHEAYEMQNFSNNIAQLSWGILKAQGYAMQHFDTYFTEMWCQEHHNMSSIERHIHGDGNVLTGFYFLDCPKDSSKIIFHDPREGKVITSLPQEKEENITYASNLVNFVPEEGDLFFSNACLPHSFSKNLSNKPMRFIHFNIAVTPTIPKHCQKPKVEVV
jgi:hypothetical protein